MSSCFSCFGWCHTKRPKAKAFYHSNGHRFMSQRIKTNAVCDHCHKRFWNLKRKAHICIFCDVVVHKKCRMLVSQCGEDKKDEQGSAQKKHVPETTQDKQGSADEEHVQETSPSKDEQGSAHVIQVRAQVHAPESSPSKDQQGSAEERHDPEPTQDEQGSAHVVQVHVPEPTPSTDQQGSAEERHDPEPTQDEQGSAHVVQVHVPEPTPSTIEPVPKEAESVLEPPASLEPPPNKIEDLDFIKFLGKGFFGKVHLVRAKKNQQKYALKAVSKKMAQEDPDTFWTERAVLSETSDCPFLVTMTSCFQTPTKLCYLMEYVSGGNMSELLDQRGPQPDDHLRFYAAEMSLGLRYLHLCDIIHRDLKVDNILLDAEGHIKITDFGNSKICFNEKEGTRTPRGMFPYTAPEIHMRNVYGFAVDWWALGLVLFEMATRKYPFAEDISTVGSGELANAIISKPPNIPHYVSEELYSLLDGFLCKDPAKRLGCWPEPGFLSLTCHPFFTGLDWEMAENKMLPPPYKPGFEEQDYEFEESRLSPVEQEELDEINQNKFYRFDCVV